MTRDELKDEVAKVRDVANATGSYAYCFAHGEKGLVEVRVREDGRALVTPVDEHGRPDGKARRIWPWTSA